MQFQVPQFIEVEDKIFGPLTFKQFIYMGGGLGTAYILWRLLPSFLALPLALGVVGMAAALAFMQYNGRPFIMAVESAFYYYLHDKLYLWNNTRKATTAVAVKTVSRDAAQVYVPKLSESKLHDLAWSLDIQERIAAGTIEDPERAPRNRVAPITIARDALIQ